VVTVGWKGARVVLENGWVRVINEGTGVTVATVNVWNRVSPGHIRGNFTRRAGEVRGYPVNPRKTTDGNGIEVDEVERNGLCLLGKEYLKIMLLMYFG